jgi:hypothetical protein
VPIHFVCPHCAVATDIAERFAGQAGPCAHCGKAITIPSPDGEPPEPVRDTTTTVVAIAVAVLCVVGLTVGMVLWWLSAQSGDTRALRVACASNLKQLALAMQAYEAANGCFPPAYVADKRGKPLYSWRVLLLPYLDEQDLADQFHFDEPWNSPSNRMVTDLTIGLFQCPAQPAVRDPTTNYMMVVGPHTISSGREPVKLAEITDGLADTILLVEVADSRVWWAEPEDLRFDQINFKINSSKRQGISSYHPGGVNAAFCGEHPETQDGVVRFLKDSMNPQLVKAMLTIDAAEDASANQ